MKIALAPVLTAACLAFSLTVSSLQAQEYRQWTDAQGRKVEAQFVKIVDDVIHLQTRDGSIYRFPLSNLSDADQRIAKGMKTREVTSAPTDGSYLASAKRIDELVAADLRARNIKPNPPLSDEQFVRRIYLDITGTIPNYEQTKEFIRSSDAKKREKLINKLLDSEGYRSHMYNYFADMLRLRNDLSDNANMVDGSPYIQWVKDCIDGNVPYDKMVRDMLTAEGKVWINPASGYLLRDSGMPLDNLANTASIFLGTDIACAQCHDHPFDDRSQMDFYKLAAFFGATTTQLGYNDLKNAKNLEKIQAEIREMGRPVVVNDLRARDRERPPGPDADSFEIRVNTELDNRMRVLEDMINANRYSVADLGQNRLRLPNDYKYEDGQPNMPVDPAFMKWADAPANLRINHLKADSPQELRKIFAEWTVSPENPRFAMTIANRMWSRAMGVGVAPIGNIGKVEESSNPELLRFLESEMKRLRFNLKDFMRVVYNSQVYQREASRIDPPMGEPYHFPGPVLRRMTAEQAWDSFMTLVLGDVDQYKADPGERYGRMIDMDLDRVTTMTALQKMTAWVNRNRNSMMMTGGLEMMGSEGDKKEKGKESESPEMAGKQRIIVHNGMRLLRASELEQPAPNGHFLRQFGQSGRLVVDDSSSTGSVPQILMMLNGSSTALLTDSKGLIFRTMDQQKGPREKVEVVFMSVLNRMPTFRERDIAERALREGGDQGYANIIWSLVNTREFLFIQ